MSIWNTVFNTTPPNTDTPKRAASMIRELKAAIYNRIKNEHESYDSGTDGAESNDWYHREGSAKCYIGDYGGTTAFVGPVYRPDGVTTLSADDAGRICIDTNGGMATQYVWTGSAWIGLGGLPIGSLYLQLAGMAAPATLFPGTWINVSSTYAGRFFRAEGGNAVAFSDTASSAQQEQSLQPHTHTTTVKGSTSFANDNYSATGFEYLSDANRHKDSDKSYTSSSSGSVETRPINSTMRIWKRTA